jgi:hypothetical protein
VGIDLADVDTIPAKLDASAWPGVPAVFAGLVGALPKELVMTTDLRCYGDDIQALAEVVPDFDLRSPMDVESWYRASGRRSPTPSASRSSSPPRRGRCPRRRTASRR